ncbi:hypothetical protein H2509_13525 [Stappia sp. F7233]|uniref:Uncharacterized protein n=1 Tax=Stappia albiluteola TaxID=2758565 RepID=A0A839AG82_9HYPH|nr:hypothetical protein [Stappia albiluteola]MBA5777473.1 hypothetical protein [Stappia albiluteola]MBA5777511.1 hypothetical protein [Stappia albiluteola]MBA5778078.1 hypothetical protein [Stappia albiluteola]MBA5778145.1 hypothetical protein [Stappia albiluteola]
MIAGRLTMRAMVERNVAAGSDAWNNPVAPEFQPLAVVKCFVWSRLSQEIVDGDKTAMVEDMRAMFPLAADVDEKDEISAVTDARGNVIIAGRLRIEGPVQRKHTHLEAALKRIR